MCMVASYQHDMYAISEKTKTKKSIIALISFIFFFFCSMKYLP